MFAFAGSKQRNKQAHLLKLFLKKESFTEVQYPNLSAAMRHFKDTEGGQNKVCKSIENFEKNYASDYAKECVYESKLTIVKNLMETVNFSVEKAMESIKLSDDEKAYVLANLEK